MEQARDDLANELASGTPNYAQAVAGATRYCPLISHVLRSLEKAVRTTLRRHDEVWPFCSIWKSLAEGNRRAAHPRKGVREGNALKSATRT